MPVCPDLNQTGSRVYLLCIEYLLYTGQRCVRLKYFLLFCVTLVPRDRYSAEKKTGMYIYIYDD